MKDVFGIEGECGIVLPPKKPLKEHNSDGVAVGALLSEKTAPVGKLRLLSVEVSVRLPAKQSIVCMPFLELKTIGATRMSVTILKGKLVAKLDPPVSIEVIFVEEKLLVHGFTYDLKKRTIDPDIRGGEHAKDVDALGTRILQKLFSAGLVGTLMDSPNYDFYSDPDPLTSVLTFWAQFSNTKEGMQACSWDQLKICSGDPLKLWDMRNPTVAIDLLSVNGFNLDDAHVVNLVKRSQVRLSLDVDGTVQSVVEKKAKLGSLTFYMSDLSVLGTRIHEVSVHPGGIIDGVLQRANAKKQSISEAPTIQSFIAEAFQGIIRQQCDRVLGPLKEGELCDIMSVPA